MRGTVSSPTTRRGEGSTPVVTRAPRARVQHNLPRGGHFDRTAGGSRSTLHTTVQGWAAVVRVEQYVANSTQQRLMLPGASEGVPFRLLAHPSLDQSRLHHLRAAQVASAARGVGAPFILAPPVAVVTPSVAMAAASRDGEAVDAAGAAAAISVAESVLRDSPMPPPIAAPPPSLALKHHHRGQVQRSHDRSWAALVAGVPPPQRQEWAAAPRLDGLLQVRRRSHALLAPLPSRGEGSTWAAPPSVPPLSSAVPRAPTQGPPSSTAAALASASGAVPTTTTTQMHLSPRTPPLPASRGGGSAHGAHAHPAPGGLALLFASVVQWGVAALGGSGGGGWGGDGDSVEGSAAGV